MQVILRRSFQTAFLDMSGCVMVKMHYLDASVLIKLFVKEDDCDNVREFFCKRHAKHTCHLTSKLTFQGNRDVRVSSSSRSLNTLRI